MHLTNLQIQLAARPIGFPKLTDFQAVETANPVPAEGELLLETLWLSVDPYMRGRMSDAKSYAEPVKLGEVMVGGTVNRVVESKADGFKAGDIVAGFSGWQRYAIANPKQLRKLDPTLAPISTALGVVGMPGLTAYFGLLDVCDPKAGETVVVSGAAGAVGSIVGQIAKIKGCRVVGIAGTNDKVKWLVEEMGFDAAYNYKDTPNHLAKLRQLCPNGIDVYFDNVGGVITDAAMIHMNVHARVAICGQISQYNLEQPEMGPRMLGMLIVKRAKVQGLLVTDYMARWGEGTKELGGWLKSGKLKYEETIVDGLEKAPEAFLAMLRGENTGKMLVRVEGN